MKVTRDQIQARAQELRTRKFTIRATLEMNAGARPVSSTPRSNSNGSINAAKVENAPGTAPNEHDTHEHDTHQDETQAHVAHELDKSA